MYKEKIQQAIELYELAGIHPAANLMPMMSESDYQIFLKDVDTKGFLHPVRITSDRLVIDGRNRLCASMDLSKDVSFETYNPTDPIAYVLSENLARRHLTVGQRACIAIDAEKMYSEDAKKRQAEAGSKNLKDFKDNSLVETNSSPLRNDSQENKSAKKAADLVGIGSTAVKQGKKLEVEAPELFERVKTGEITLNKAMSIFKKMKKAKEMESNPEPEPEPKLELSVEKAVKIVRSNSKFNETNESIEWSRYTWNPVTGCKMGCKYCYAHDIAMRFNGNFEPAFHADRLDAPYNTKCKAGYPANVFVCSMADLFGTWVKKEWIEQVIFVVKENPQWNFLFLTKNPERYLEFQFPVNSWLGATADIQSRAEKAIDVFNRMDKTHVHFLSCEPLLEKIKICNAKNLQWLIIGGQSKTTEVPELQPEWAWVQKLVVSADKLNIPIYFKPNLTVRPRQIPA